MLENVCDMLGSRGTSRPSVPPQHSPSNHGLDKLDSTSVKGGYTIPLSEHTLNFEVVVSQNKGTLM